VQHHGIRPGSMPELWREVVQEQFGRLEKGKPTAWYDIPHPVWPYSVVMSRVYGENGPIVSVHVFATDSQEVRPYWEAQERVRKGESQA